MKIFFCIFCNSKTKDIKHNLPLFDHFGFKTVSKRINFKKCLKCNLVYNPKKIKNLFFNKKEYAHYMNDHILQKKNNKTLTRKSILANLLKDLLKNISNPKVLEIGCSDGELLKKLDKKIKNGLFYGTEKNAFNKKKFPKKNNFKFLINPNLNKLKKNYFDLIILSHVFNYLINPKKSMLQFKNLLKNNGQILIVLPNIAKNPFYSLMGDQKLILTEKSLTNILKKFNFKTKIIKENYLKRELVILANKSKARKFSYVRDNTFENNIKKINKIKNKFLHKKIKNFSIFGTTINSACLDEFNNRKTNHFVDEFSSKTNLKFRNKNIIDPNKLKSSDQVIFSLYKNNKLKNRIKKKYLGKLISL